MSCYYLSMLPRTIYIAFVVSLCACATTPVAKIAPPPKDLCRDSTQPRAKVERRYHKGRDTTVVHLKSDHAPFCGSDTSLVLIGTHRGQDAGVAPSELTLGLLSRSRAFRLVGCSSLKLVADDAPTPMLAERLPEIAAGGVLKEYVLGPIPLQTFLRVLEARRLTIDACGIIHFVRPDEQEAVSDLLRQLGAR